MFIFKNDIKLFDKLPNSGGIRKEIPTRQSFELPNTASGYLNLAFVNHWLVGFTNAVGSFLIHQNNDGCFQLKQRIHLELFEAFKLLFDSGRRSPCSRAAEAAPSPEVRRTGKKIIYFEKDKYIQLSLSSKTDIQKVINFFSFSGYHPLIGGKLIEYLTWVDKVKTLGYYNDKSDTKNNSNTKIKNNSTTIIKNNSSTNVKNNSSTNIKNTINFDSQLSINLI
uniref:LAGLIDADG homing endonuclease n=1 Tax=Phanerochaete carnosa TaxID=231932 RepID=A0A895KXK0_9APHY|nr:LAGLIDADG homing endonuclease [Phanerochaete carnosa]QRZ60424.1 LAGLIDADG homing endonuclease [Phanerochaete carnosa]